MTVFFLAVKEILLIQAISELTTTWILHIHGTNCFLDMMQENIRSSF